MKNPFTISIPVRFIPAKMEPHPTRAVNNLLSPRGLTPKQLRSIFPKRKKNAEVR
jgi:hypothetical protein